MTHLRLTLGVEPRGIAVAWRLDGAAFATGEAVGELPRTIAGVPTLDLADDAVTVEDDEGPVPLVVGTSTDDEGVEVRRWVAARATTGSVELSHRAMPSEGERRAATPPLELRREGPGMSGAVKCFAVLPPGPEDLTFDLRWVAPEGAGDGWTVATSVGEGLGDLHGAGRECLLDTYVICGDLARSHHRDGDVSTWWLTEPGFDVVAFTESVGSTYDLLAQAFDAPATPYRVFLRAHAHRGTNGSAHPASFVLAMDPEHPADDRQLFVTVAHELVHEWLRLDGTPGEITWFVEGAADYYSLVLPFRAGLLDGDSVVRELNLAARMAYASPLRHLTLAEASASYWSDFRAHRLPYARGMFYLADLDVRLRRATDGRRSLDDVVVDVVRRRREGERVGLDEWCDRVGEMLRADERPTLESFVFAGDGRPGPGSFGSHLDMAVIDAPVLDLGLDASTFVTRHVRGLVPDGPAARAGLVEGEPIELPGYSEVALLDIDDELEVTVLRDGGEAVVRIPLGATSTPVPQWAIADAR